VIIRKIRKVGQSLYVVLNKNYLKALKIKLSDYVMVMLKKDKIVITKLEIKKRYKKEKQC